MEPAESETLVSETPARVMEMRRRQMPGWLRLDSDELRTQDELSTWVQRGLTFARSLPAGCVSATYWLTLALRHATEADPVMRAVALREAGDTAFFLGDEQRASRCTTKVWRSLKTP